jgi:nickel transport protein
MSKKYLIFCLSFIFYFTFSESIIAHRVNLFAEIDSSIIKTESFYSSGEKVNNGDIKVYDYQSNKILYEGKTDTNGMLWFNIPSKTLKDKAGLKIVLNAGMGHKAEWDIRYDELRLSLKAHNDKSEKLTQKQVIDNKIKKAAIVNASKISFFQVALGLIIIWVVFGSAYIALKKFKK